MKDPRGQRNVPMEVAVHGSSSAGSGGDGCAITRARGCQEQGLGVQDGALRTLCVPTLIQIVQDIASY